MVGLLDVASLTETVEVGGSKVTLHPITANSVAVLMQRFGNIFEVLRGGGDAATVVGPAIGAVIAASTGDLGNQELEAKAAGLSIGDQVSLLAAIRRLTMPNGPRPFFQDLSALGLPVEDLLRSFDQISQLTLPSASST